MKRFTPLFILLSAAVMPLLLASCAGSASSGAGGEVTGVGGSAWTEPTPYGMVQIDRGSMKVGPAKADSAWNLRADARGISVDGFW
ncbi:MAG: gliding motility-associated lipoprotein GldK, partial [Muribaculaceae bacterium]|nr:gliding motility-associated lipoprotein GldK [Muribaculaceae bacterium]